MRIALLLALLSAGRCWWTWDRLGYTMEPDFALYTQGGLGLFPSPLGRALGALGAQPFAIVSSVAAGAVVLLVALLARQNGGSPALAAALAALMPASLYLGYAGIDAIGLALLLAALLWRSSALGVAAALTHLSLAPFTLLLLPRATWPARLLLGGFSLLLLACLLLTPYSGVIFGAFTIEAVSAVALGWLAFLAIAAPALVFARRDRLVTLAVLIGLAECAAQHHLQARYLLPAAFLVAATARRRHLHRWLTAAHSRALHPRERGDGHEPVEQSELVQRWPWSDPPAAGEAARAPAAAVLRKSAGSATPRKAAGSSSGLPTCGGQRP